MERLAVDGGKPVRSEPFPSWPWFWEEEKKAVLEVLDSGKVNYWTGSKGVEFQDKFAQYIGVKHGIAVNSGTSALHVALAAAEIGPGDEVIVPSYTFIATATAVLHQNAIPVFADIDAETHNIDPDSVRRNITEYTRAIIPVHMEGHPAEMDEIMKIAKEHNLIVIEDCSQAHGAEYKGRKIGSIGDVNAFSFCVSKIITTGGEGGMVTTDNEDFAKIARSFKDHGYDEERQRKLLAMGKRLEYIHYRMGYNYRMTEMQSAIGISMLKKLDGFVDKRRENAKYLTEGLKDIGAVNPVYEAPYVKHAYFNYGCTLNLDKITVDKEQFAKAVAAEGVPAGDSDPTENYLEEVFQKRVGYGKTHYPFSNPLYKGKVRYEKGLCPNAHELGRRIFMLEVYPTIEKKDLDDVIAAIEKVAQAYGR